jgi:rod shape-determining protein MreC
VRFLGKKAILLFVAVFTVILLAGSFVHGKVQFAFMDRVVITLLSPFEYAVSSVGVSLRQITTATGEIFTVYGQNQALKAEIDNYRQNNLDMTEILAENDRLRAMLDYKKTATQFDFVTAMVVARDPGTWTSVIIVNKGTNDGITKDMPVVTQQGLVGNVVQAYATSAKIQLILDPRSAVGALNQRSESRVAGIVEGSGTNHNAPRLLNLARDADIVPGDTVVTSGFGGIYPKGLAVGEVLDVVNDEGGLLKYAILKPAVDFDKLEEVFILIHSREPIPTLPLAPKSPASGQGVTSQQVGGGSSAKGASSP